MPERSYRSALIAHFPPGPDRASARKVLEALGLFGKSPTLTKMIDLLEGGGTSKPPPPPSPISTTPPSISVSWSHKDAEFTVTGDGFSKNHIVHIRVHNDATWADVTFNTESDSNGRVTDFVISFPINLPQQYTFTANDERVVPSSVDHTGTLWSAPVKVTAT